MSAVISAFPGVEAIEGRFTFIPHEYEFYYHDREESVKLSLEEEGKSYTLSDEYGIWSPEEYDICFRRHIEIKGATSMFGSDGIACKNALLGVAVVWTSSESKQRGVIRAGSFSASDVNPQFDIEYSFPTSFFRGSVAFTTILFIDTPGTPEPVENHLANEYGCILGQLEDEMVVLIDGDGSDFPIYTVSESGKPLWYVKCDWDDPAYDSFSDTVAIFLNSANRNYRFIDPTNKNCYNDVLLKEIMASALGIIIAKLKEDEEAWRQTYNGDNLEEGSVSQAVYYFINTLEWDTNSPENTSLTIRKYLDSRM